MPFSNPNIPPIQTQNNIKPIGAPAPINADNFAADFGKNAANAFIPNLSTVTQAPTIIDANSLGILIQGAGFGQVKSFIASAAIKANEAVYKIRENEVLLGNATIYANPITAGAQLYFNKDNASFVNPNKLIGNYLFDAVIFFNNTINEYQVDKTGNMQLVETLRIPDILLNACILSVSANRYIHQSIPIGNEVGTVKEIMSFGEYQIKLSGHLVNNDKPMEYATDAIKALDQLSKTQNAVNINSLFLTLLGINKVVIEKYTLDQVEGFNGVTTFTIDMISETDIPNNSADRSNSGGTDKLVNPNIKQQYG
jgi:hypothetical protein